jgi:hypothetical protein
MSAWSHLPNAKHIDQVLASVRTYPEIWNTTWPTVRTSELYDKFRTSFLKAYESEIWDTFLDSNLDSALRTVPDESFNAVYDTLLALVVYDYSSKYLTMPSEHLKTWALLSDDPPAILLVPAISAFELIDKLEENLDTHTSID